MSLSLNVGIYLESRKTATAGQSIATDRYLVQGSTTYTDGTGAGAANKQWNDNRTLGGSSDSLDLAGGLTNRIGEAASFATVRLVYLRADADNAADLTVGGGSNPWDTAFDTLTVQPGQEILLKTTDATGWTVTAGTGDLLQVAGTSGDSYEIYLAGE